MTTGLPRRSGVDGLHVPPLDADPSFPARTTVLDGSAGVSGKTLMTGCVSYDGENRTSTLDSSGPSQIQRIGGATKLASFDAHEPTAIAEFLAHSTDVAYCHVAVLRAQGTAQTPDAFRGQSRQARSPKAHRARI